MSNNARERLPGTEGLWIFVFIDMLIFAMIFFVFMSERLDHYELYRTSQKHLNEIIGFINTLVLLTSSWLVVEAIQSAKQLRPERVSMQLTLVLLLGLVFSVNKIFEYYSKIEAGIGASTNSFYSFYFFITFVHFLHVLGGMVAIFIFRNNSRACLRPGSYVTGLESAGLFWHYVDILWIFIFPLLYLI